MAIENSNNRTLFQVVGELDGIQDYLRISHQLIVDQMCEATVGDAKSMETVHERLYVLMDSHPAKLAQMAVLSAELHQIGRAAKQAA